MSGVSAYRRRNIISWPYAAAVAAPPALGVALSGFLDFGGWEALIVGVCVVASVIVLGPRLRTGMQLDDHRPGDYPPHYAAAPVLGWAGSLVASAPVFDVIDERVFASPLLGWLSVAGLFAGLTVFGAWSVRRLEARDARVGNGGPASFWPPPTSQRSAKPGWRRWVGTGTWSPPWPGSAPSTGCRCAPGNSRN